MPEELLFSTEERRDRGEIARRLADAAEQLESGTVTLESPEGEHTVEVPAEAILEVELESMTDSETGETRIQLEYELAWTE